MQGNCLQANVVDKADITTTDNSQRIQYKIPEPHEINQQQKISKRDRTFQIHLATERQQLTTQDQVGNHQENSVQQTRPEEMGPMPLTETIDFNRTKQKHFK